MGAAFEPRHHPTFITYPKSLADFFADRAKTLLEIELDSPSIATVQALVILSGHDIGCTRDGRGWLYSGLFPATKPEYRGHNKFLTALFALTTGMAMRLAFHLALHLDMTSYLTSKSISLEEANLRRDVFWAAYTVDQSVPRSVPPFVLFFSSFSFQVIHARVAVFGAYILAEHSA